MTAPDADAQNRAMQIAFYRQLGPVGRLELAFSLSGLERALTRVGIRSRHPEYSEEEVEWARRRLSLGDDLFRRAWPHAPLLER